MFIESIKKINSTNTITIVLLIMVCFICGIIIFNTAIIVHHLKYKGDAAYEQGVFGDAEVFYRKAIEKKQGQYLVHYNLGNAYYKQGRYAEAIESYRKVLKSKSGNLKGLALNNLGNAYYKQNKLLQSALAYKKALLLLKDNLRARQNFLFLINKLEDKQVKIIPVMKRIGQKEADKKNDLSENEQKDNRNEKSNNKSTAGDKKITDKSVNDLFKVINQNEDDAMRRISKSKHLPVKIKPTEPDY